MQLQRILAFLREPLLTLKTQLRSSQRQRPHRKNQLVLHHQVTQKLKDKRQQRLMIS